MQVEHGICREWYVAFTIQPRDVRLIGHRGELRQYFLIFLLRLFDPNAIIYFQVLEIRHYLLVLILRKRKIMITKRMLHPWGGIALFVLFRSDDRRIVFTWPTLARGLLDGAAFRPTLFIIKNGCHWRLSVRHQLAVDQHHILVKWIAFAALLHALRLPSLSKLWLYFVFTKGESIAAQSYAGLNGLWIWSWRLFERIPDYFRYILLLILLTNNFLGNSILPLLILALFKARLVAIRHILIRARVLRRKKAWHSVSRSGFRHCRHEDLRLQLSLLLRIRVVFELFDCFNDLLIRCRIINWSSLISFHGLI